MTDKDDDRRRHHDEDHGKERDHDKDHDHNGDHGGDHGGKGGTTTGDGGTYKGPTATPYLLIPSGTGDTGVRPIPAGQAVMNDSIKANIVVGTTWTDFQLQLSCVVADLGVMGCAAGLAEFYVGDQFSIWNSAHEGLTAAQVKANAKLIGYASFQVPPGGTVTVTCKKLWKPGSSDAAQKGVLVQVHDLFTDHMTAPFDALNDRHVARNDEVMDPIIF
jgi:hypothetical protein